MTEKNKINEFVPPIRNPQSPPPLKDVLASIDKGLVEDLDNTDKMRRTGIANTNAELRAHSYVNKGFEVYIELRDDHHAGPYYAVCCEPIQPKRQLVVSFDSKAEADFMAENVSRAISAFVYDSFFGKVGKPEHIR